MRALVTATLDLVLLGGGGANAKSLGRPTQIFVIEAYMHGFKAQCSAIAPLANGEPIYHWNLKGSEHISPKSIQEFGESHGFPFVQM